ncbi:ANTAR domain-containing protein [Streptomyces sp. ID05-04B]|uniref:ANTAR domain-containing protein n=1 Tax=unclassified Streptomyces TaxID=2593676 RepID=UPI000D1BFFF6|nr:MULTISPECIES: ANTAR domain-containing protein [unclassified Streptomyces]AVV46950.1 ANTAR domain-containing protein [Streptomyces sp. P3]MDX5565062.1 ANTAR domain-containing protein [Streptomyces sp. ID05-04B]
MGRVPRTSRDETTRIFELQEEVEQLKEAVDSHAVVDQAIGVVVALGRMTPDEGWAVLREVSQHTNVKLRSVAELILLWGRRGELPPDIRAELEDVLDRYGPTQVPGAPPLEQAVPPRRRVSRPPRR